MRRLYSIDAFRGFDMMFIMGVEGLIIAVCSLFPGGENCWLACQMEHVEWNGFHIMDTVFPTFLFIAGLSWPFSYASQVAKGSSRGKIYLKILRRFAILLFFGLLYNGLGESWNLTSARWCSVLGRIGLCWAISCVLFINFGRKAREIIAASLLVGYYLLLRFVPVPGAEGLDPFSFEGNLVGYIDRCITPGTFYKGTFDPEGLLSTIPAIVTAMLGVFTGEMLRDESISDKSKCLKMIVACAAMLAAGLIWSIWFPINKALWSSSFVLVAGAYSIGIFCIFYYITDVRGYRKWAFPFMVIGVNSITIYMAQAIIPFSRVSDFFFGGLVNMFPLPVGDVISSVCYVLVCWTLLYFLYRKKIFLKV